MLPFRWAEPSQYSDRIPSSVWDEHEAEIRWMHRQHLTYAEIREILREHGLDPSQSQLQRQFKKWNLKRYGTESSTISGDHEAAATSDGSGMASQSLLNTTNPDGSSVLSDPVTLNPIASLSATRTTADPVLPSTGRQFPDVDYPPLPPWDTVSDGFVIMSEVEPNQTDPNSDADGRIGISPGDASSAVEESIAVVLSQFNDSDDENPPVFKPPSPQMSSRCSSLKSWHSPALNKLDSGLDVDEDEDEDEGLFD